jgi:hypothetical protein
MKGGAPRKPMGSRGYNKLYREYKRNADIRGLRFDLSIEEFKKLIIQNCFYCGTIPRAPERKLDAFMDFWPPANGVDRINPNKGYTLVNCIPACKTCNNMKGILGMHEFIEHVRRVHEKTKTREKF